MWEFAPTGSSRRMTWAQVRQYVKNMKKAQAKAQAKLRQAKQNGVLDESSELKKLEELMDDL